MDDARPGPGLAAIRATLEAELAEIAAASEAAAETRKPVTLDQQSVGRLSRMDALQVQAMAQAVEGRRQGREARIKATLKRLDEGEYGYCVACGEDIPAKRLALDATTARCVECST
jgi:DnaK suppressor protein